MYVVKRDGKHEDVHFDKITTRIRSLMYGLNTKYIDPTLITQKVCQGIYEGIKTSELDELAAETAAHLTSTHPDYGILAARIAVSNLHKSTLKKFSMTCAKLYNYVVKNTKAPKLSDHFYNFVKKNKDKLNAAIIHRRDYDYDYFGFKTLEKSYLLKIDNEVVERPQHMLMRVAVGLHAKEGCDKQDEEQIINLILETYELLSTRYFTHATPTLFNAGTLCPQLSSW